MADGMMERICKAIERHFEDCPELGQQRFDRATRDVLELMREPTDEMLDAAIAPYRDGNTEEFNTIYRRTVAGYFRDGIGAALKVTAVT
jgi:hypothetical protein